MSARTPENHDQAAEVAPQKPAATAAAPVADVAAAAPMSAGPLGPGGLSGPGQVVAMQRSAGNAAVSAMLARSPGAAGVTSGTLTIIPGSGPVLAPETAVKDAPEEVASWTATTTRKPASPR